MPTAFGRAMLATINGQPQRFRMSMQDGPTIEMKCSDLLTLRPEEADLNDNLVLPAEGSVLDWGCGVGRHVAHVRRKNPSVHCVCIETCDLLLDYCRRAIAYPATFVATYDAVADQQFDLIMIMGNSLGVLGNEEDATEALRRLVEALRPNGTIVIETGNPFGAGYFSGQFVIEYGADRDGPFTWACADRDWISRTLTDFGCTTSIRRSDAPGGIFFFAVGSKTGDNQSLTTKNITTEPVATR